MAHFSLIHPFPSPLHNLSHSSLISMTDADFDSLLSEPHSPYFSRLSLPFLLRLRPPPPHLISRLSTSSSLLLCFTRPIICPRSFSSFILLSFLFHFLSLYSPPPCLDPHISSHSPLISIKIKKKMLTLQSFALVLRVGRVHGNCHY